ncbi:hypothetical protein RUM44_007243 [Polyplax serrata]|uniref:Uncharacterized protein n=1 Tax=Polyplax serrata TaxID=468196 RepID=A0ABR1B048_POLSC
MRDVPGRLQCMDLVTENKTKWQQEQMLPQPPADLGFLFLRTFPDRDETIKEREREKTTLNESKPTGKEGHLTGALKEKMENSYTEEKGRAHVQVRSGTYRQGCPVLMTLLCFTERRLNFFWKKRSLEKKKTKFFESFVLSQTWQDVLSTKPSRFTKFKEFKAPQEEQKKKEEEGILILDMNVRVGGRKVQLIQFGQVKLTDSQTDNRHN